MPDHFEFTYGSLDGLEFVRWIGDPWIPGWKRDDLWGDGTPRFVEEYMMSGSAAILYPTLLGTVWRLTEGLARFALPEFDGVLDCERREYPYQLVRWEYGVEWERRDWRERDQGFIAAESLRPGPRRVRADQRLPQAALARVDTWPDLVSLIPVGDQANTLCLFAVQTGRAGRDRLLRVLRGTDCPRIEDVAQSPGDVFAVITHEDEGQGLSSLLVAGRDGLQGRFAEEASLLQQRVDDYLIETTAAATHEDWLSAIARLAGLRH